MYDLLLCGFTPVLSSMLIQVHESMPHAKGEMRHRLLVKANFQHLRLGEEEEGSIRYRRAEAASWKTCEGNWPTYWLLLEEKWKKSSSSKQPDRNKQHWFTSF
ncbi:hypothetical protein AVEN_161533-1 [Araneus ventricosus]|uniref:Uncharacterized protein n=1 Tax=Araneus ventricosus TaxID=182803 RepID=A0A4Y2PD94_ARAVE|nr:hypothetical protein AVEN_229810-1 [Araneus ventricosus]GBN48492.1 hypothetical protein AVEN_161533-1 [Araneus ventricosus]